MKCFQCKKELTNSYILINQDGDFVCSEICKNNYEKDRDQFFSIIDDIERIENWLRFE